MKVATQNPDGNPGWCIIGSAPHLKIYLDEKLQREVIAADDVAGEVWTVAKDYDGQPMFDRQKGEIILKRLTGRVEIRHTAWLPPG